MNIKYSYDYSGLIQELHEELEANRLQLGGIKLTDYIQILRSKRPIFKSYHAIIDWYYDSNQMEELLRVEWGDEGGEVEELIDLKIRYINDKEHLESVLVSEVLKELEEINSVI